MERTIGIMGAMTEEIQDIVELLTERQEKQQGKRIYYSGKLYGINTVVVFSRWGKVAAATTITHLILEFKITELIFTGVAGAVDHRLNIGDIVIAERLVQHDMDARPLMERFVIPLLGMTFFESTKARIQLAKTAVKELLENKHLHSVIDATDMSKFGITAPKVFTGDIASGDKFFSGTDEKNRLQELLPSVLCVEMEGAAVAQVCYEYGIPFIVLRTISDAADEKSEFDFPLFIKRIAKKYAAEIIKIIYTHIHADE